MADVKIVDIDSAQWNMKDQLARDKIATLEEKINVTSEQLWSLDNSFINKVKINNEYFLQVHFQNFEYKGGTVNRLFILQKPLGNTETLRCQLMGDVKKDVDRISIGLDFNVDGEVLILIINQGIYIGGNFDLAIYGDAFIKIF